MPFTDDWPTGEDTPMSSARFDSARFVRETTNSPKFACWVLYDGDRVIASVLTGAGATQSEAMDLLIERERRNAAILAFLDHVIGDPE